MKRKSTWICLLLAGAVMLFYTGTSAVAEEHEHVLKVGKKGETRFNSPTKVGDLMLEPGRYKFQHQVNGADHYVHFTEWSERNPYTFIPGDPTDHPGNAKCRLEPLADKVKQTAVFTAKEGGHMRVTKILIKGENAAHLF